MSAESLSSLATLGLIATATCILWMSKGILSALTLLLGEMNSGIQSFRSEVRDFKDEVSELRIEVRRMEDLGMRAQAVVRERTHREEGIHHSAPSSSAPAPAHG